MPHTIPEQWKSDMPDLDELRWWYLSFVDPHKGWLGACCVEAVDIVDAARTARKAGCNPGGEVLGLALRSHNLTIPNELMYKLVTDAHIIELLLGDVVQVTTEGHQCEQCKREQGESHAD